MTIPHTPRRQHQRIGALLGWRLALTVSSAGAYALAFPPVGLSWLAFVGIAPFFVALRGASARLAATLGVLWGLLAAIGLGVWFPESVSTYFDRSLLFGGIALVAVALTMVSPYTAAFALLARAFDRHPGSASLLLVSCSWTLCEALRGRLLSLPGVSLANPWGLVGYSQVGSESVAQVLSLAGVYGLGFVVVACNAGIAGALAPGATGRRATLAALGLLPTLGAWGYGWSTRATETEPASVVAVVQGDIEIGTQWRADLYGAHLAHYLRLTAEAFDPSVEVVFWPESAMTFFLDEEPVYRESIGRALAGAELIAGGPSRERGPDGTRYRNTVWRMGPDGEIRGRYDKQRLLPFAETAPRSFAELQNRTFDGVRTFVPGRGDGILPTVVGRAGIAVCNEAMLPEVVAQRVANGAEYLVNPTNDTWISHPQYVELQFEIARARAIEQSRYLVRASTSGPSAVIDPRGRVVSRVDPGAAGVLKGTIAARSARTLYSRFGDWFPLACSLAIAFGIARGVVASREST